MLNLKGENGENKNAPILPLGMSYIQVFTLALLHLRSDRSGQNGKGFLTVLFEVARHWVVLSSQMSAASLALIVKWGATKPRNHFDAELDCLNVLLLLLT